MPPPPGHADEPDADEPDATGPRAEGGRTRWPNMAPLAIAARSLRGLPTTERRRWFVAAAVTGAMLTSHPATRDELLRSLPHASAEVVAADASGTVVQLAKNPPGTVAVASSGAAAPVASQVTPGDRSPELGAGALPDGVVELARFGEVLVAAEGSRVELVGFHESSAAQALTFEPAEGLVSDDGPVMVLPTRHRAGGPTSAIDLAVTPGEEVVAPISGEVVEVAEFALYGRTSDLLVSIRSVEDPTVVATVMHLVEARVAVGDHVEAGVTPIAGEARQLPFASQIDRFAAAHRGSAAPHVHLELRHA
jgi:biotin carboxyl carrier protein